MNRGFLKDCPCDICIVQAACNESCLVEILWYSKLSEEDKEKYIDAGRYKETMSRDAAEFVARDYAILDQL